MKNLAIHGDLLTILLTFVTEYHVRGMRLLTHILLFLCLCMPQVVLCQRSDIHKLSPWLRARYMCNETVQTLSLPQQTQPLYVLLKHSADITDLYDRYHCTVLATVGDIDVIALHSSSLVALTHDSRVVRVECGSALTVQNTTSQRLIHADAVHQGVNLPQAYTGRGVVLGITDIGFDLTNPTFYTPDLTDYRIKALWDMLSTDTVGSPFFLGREYVGTDELLAYEHSRDALICHHGSHTLGTAAGAGYEGRYAGVAYDSDLCLVANVVSDNAELLDSIAAENYSSAATVLAFKYLFDYADSVGKPCVISCSEGAQQWLADDDALYCECLDALSGPGHIIVASAGNNSQYARYMHKSADESSAGTFIRSTGHELYFFSQGTADYTIDINFYSSEQHTYTLDSRSLITYPDSVFTDTLHLDGYDYVISSIAYTSGFNDSNTVMECYIVGPENIGYSSTHLMSLIARGDEADVEVMGYAGVFVSNDLDPTLDAAETSHNIVTPAAAPAVIAVGATAYEVPFTDLAGEEHNYDYGHDGERASFSSIGPALDGSMKPDVMAPGTTIISSTNSFFFEANPDSRYWADLIDEYTYNDRTYYWKTDAGTSMSAPFVAGAIALWLEADATLTPDKIRDIFSTTCTHPDDTMTYPNNYYGYGQIDVYAGLLAVLQLSGVHGISSSQPRDVTMTVHDGCLTITFCSPLTTTAQVNIFSLSGQILATTTVHEGSSAVSLPVAATTNSVIAVQLLTNDAATSGSTLIRL